MEFFFDRITGLKSKKEISKFGNGLNKFHVKKLIVTPKGSSYLIAEHLSVNKTEKENSIKNNKNDLLRNIKLTICCMLQALFNQNAFIFS